MRLSAAGRGLCPVLLFSRLLPTLWPHGPFAERGDALLPCCFVEHFQPHPLGTRASSSPSVQLEQTCKKEFSIVDQSVTPEYRPYRKEHRSTESHGNPQSRVFARVGLSPECPLRAEKHSPAGEGPEDSPWERSQAVPTRGLGDAGANLSCQQPRVLDEESLQHGGPWAVTAVTAAGAPGDWCSKLKGRQRPYGLRDVSK
ncbi:uncharacterized protein LOC112404619 isoform X2 [Neophocaena asiaeorientalis asiaeorientalis]|uniref:Uncharacterized protein LOC112404619 isoform X2 n=1 Tax=Neophocaena asiaeorientalis asiaeorientalis TaxID=1706337 RepID=A0A341C265_NEOAA|nr:uncharacterized protein LOC112404619 isoform X2 [Neophocaena asiaeorientalis asiaeorientalis]